MFRTIIIIFCILSCGLAFSATYPMPKPGNDIIGENFTAKAQAGDTLGSLGLRYGMSLHEMLEANPDLKMSTRLRKGQEVYVPAQFILPPFRDGIVVNMAELRLYYFPPGGEYVMTFPVAMGRDEWRTPTVTTKVVSKEADPVWHVPESIRTYTLEHKGELLPEEVLPGPDNPLGPFVLYLGKTGYLIHGNNSPTSIGKFVSSGCIRMKNTDIETLFNLVNIGTTVRVVHIPNKLGWFNGKLYLESQMPVDLPDEPVSDLNYTSIDGQLQNMLDKKVAVINWDKVRQTVAEHRGVPQLIGRAEDWQSSAGGKERRPPQAVSDDVMNSSSESNNNEADTEKGADITDLSQPAEEH